MFEFIVVGLLIVLIAGVGGIYDRLEKLEAKFDEFIKSLDTVAEEVRKESSGH
jgi:Na+-transporting methylmalonyl-CoA/oxaloacetate decarboxylase gamma subunit